MSLVHPRIRPCLWFDGTAEDAVNHYVAIFPNAKVLGVSRYSEAGPGKPGSVMVMEFELDGVRMQALNAGPHYSFTPAISMSIDCADQAEVDYYWEKLGAGGTYIQCGWLTDRFGLSWQVVPRRLPEFVGGPDKAGAARAMNAMRTMVKLDVDAVERAYRGL